MSQDCCKPDGNVMILACSGGSNVGQLSNQAAVELTLEGCHCFYRCLETTPAGKTISDSRHSNANLF